MAFDYNSRVPNIQGQVTQEANTSNGGIINNVWFPGGFRLLLNDDTYLAPISPNDGYPLYEYYKVYQLPSSIANAPDSILSYFANCGFNAEAGYTSSGTLYDAASVTVSGSNLLVQFNGINSSNSDFVASLVSGDTISGTWSSGSNSGAYVSCEVSGNNTIITVTGTSGQITTGGNVTITFTDTSITNPDITKTDPFVVKLYYAALFNSLNTNTDQTNYGQPNVYFSILPDSANSGYASPTSSAISGITAPTLVSEISSTSYSLQIPTTNSTSSNPVGYIPYSTLGASSLSQIVSYTQSGIIPDDVAVSGTNVTLSFLSSNDDIDTINEIITNSSILSGTITDTTASITCTFVSAQTATGTYAATISLTISSGTPEDGDSFTLNLTGTVSGTIKSSYLSGNYIIVTLNNVTGLFLAGGNTLTLNLDSSQTIFTLQQSTFAQSQLSLSQFILPYYIENAASISDTYVDYFNYVATINQQEYKSVGQGQCQIVFEADPTIVTALSTASTTLQAITGTSGNYQYVALYNNYDPEIGNINQIPNGEGTFSAVAATAMCSNQYTSGDTNSLSPLANLVLYGLNNDPDTAITYYVGGDADAIQQVGWNPACINSDGYTILPWAITNQLKIPGKNTTDTALYPVYIWQVVDYFERAGLYPINSLYTGSKQSPSNYKTVISLIASFMNELEDDQVLINVANNLNYLSISQSTTNPFYVIESIVLQPYPAWIGTVYTIYLYGSGVTVSATPTN